MTFTGKRQPDGTFQAQSGFSFDQFNQDQILYFQYNDNNGRRNAGLTIADRADVDIYDLVAERDSITKANSKPRLATRPAEVGAASEWRPLFAPRVYLGRDNSKAAVVNLSDRNGKPDFASWSIRQVQRAWNSSTPRGT